MAYCKNSLEMWGFSGLLFSFVPHAAEKADPYGTSISLWTMDLLYFIVCCTSMEVTHWPLKASCCKPAVTACGQWVAVLGPALGFLYFPGWGSTAQQQCAIISCLLHGSFQGNSPAAHAGSDPEGMSASNALMEAVLGWKLTLSRGLVSLPRLGTECVLGI